MKNLVFRVIFLVLLINYISLNAFASGNNENKNTQSDSSPALEVKKSSTLPDLKGRTIIAVTGNDYVPLNFVDRVSGKSIGFEYDLVNTIGYLLNAKIQWRTSSWDTMISAVREGQFDVGMDGITITAEREEQIDFSDPYLHSQQVMLVRADEKRFTDAKSFGANNKLLIGSQAGTTQFYTAVYEILDGDENNPRIKLLDNFALTVRALLSGDVDLVLMDKVSAEGYVGANGNKLKIIGKSLGNENFGFIFTPKSDLRIPFNQAIDYLKKQDKISILEKKWFYEFKIK